MTEREVKRERVRALLEGEGDAIALRDPANLAWYLGGARVHVVGGMGDAICEVVVTPDDEELRTTAIEAPRMAAEELGPGAPRLRALPWWEPLGPDAGASDRPRPGERDVAAALVGARAALLPEELERLRALASGTSAATGDALRAAASGESEFALAGRAARELLEREIEPVVLLVAGEERLPRHRHPLPTGAPLGARAMLVVCGRRHGLICSVTRMRAFTPLRPAERDTYDGLLAVEAAALDATRPGARIGDVVAAVAAAYPANGFAADEWHQHHQGGPTGYAPRDYLASPATDARVAGHQAFAWNPSGGGFKVEDTVLATADGVEVLGPDPGWPAVAAGGRQRPDVLA
jgi:Xaa-Pro aminopeptidase